MADGSPVLRGGPAVSGPMLRAAAFALPAAAGALALDVARAGTGSVAARAAALAILGAVAACRARADPRARPGWAGPLGGAAAWSLGAAGALRLALPWTHAVPASLHAVRPWLLHAPAPLGLGLLLLAAGGTAFGRLSAAPAGGGRYGRPDPVRALLGACLFALPAVVLGTACLLGGAWATRAGAAVLAAAAGAFWPAWAAAEGPAAEPHAAPPPQRTVLPQGGPGIALSGAGRRWRRRRRRPARDFRAAVRAALAGPPQGGVFPVTVRAVSPRTGALRLLALYAYAALCSAPAAVLLLLGGRGARAWADPAALGPAGQAGVLLAAALALGACTALALRSGFAHPLELGLPRPRPVPVAAGAVAAFLALRFGGPDLTPVFRHGVAGALLGAHHPVPLWLLCCLLLPAAQAAFFFGFLQTRLQECTPVWAAAVLPAAAFAISGPVTAVPLPGLVPAFALGLVLVGVRRATGAAGAALALAVGAAATLIALHVH